VLFNSYEFALFFVVVLALHRALPSHRARLWLLLVASCVFYASWSVGYLLLLAASVVGDWLLGRAIARARAGRRLLLVASVVLNLGVLAIFKYADFLVGAVAAGARAFGAHWTPQPLGLALPLGISFYTFMSLSYTIDVYRRQCEPEPSLLRYSVFLTFFPHLIAGPILRAGEFLPQLRDGEEARRRSALGINRIAIGLAKKALIADHLGRLVEPVFADPLAFDGASNLLVLYLYAFQVYFDFSAYSDIAIGCAKLLGYDLPENFDAPLLASNFVELWRRWHMTLGRWLRDYLYVPLGGNRHGAVRAGLNLFLTMTLAGLWHGASWNCLSWGALLGLLLVGSYALGRRRAGDPEPDGPPRFGWRALVTFELFSFSFVLFRAPSLEHTGHMLHQLIGLPHQPLRAAAALAAAPLLLAAYAPLTRLRRRLQTLAPITTSQAIGYGCALGIAAVVIALLAAPQAEFIYFHF
jgi:alginate O-acetyltransferase complex protein AlgI